MCVSVGKTVSNRWKTIRYVSFTFEGDQGYIELDDENYAVRQVEIERDGTRKASCFADCLAEKQIDKTDDYLMEISKAQFEAVWAECTAERRCGWDSVKAAYPVGNRVSGTIVCFYPQGVLVRLKNSMGCVMNTGCGEKGGQNAMYAGNSIQGTVTGYDEKNMWILLDVCIAEG